jgi:hypothetical protein
MLPRPLLDLFKVAAGIFEPMIGERRFSAYDEGKNRNPTALDEFERRYDAALGIGWCNRRGFGTVPPYIPCITSTPASRAGGFFCAQVRSPKMSPFRYGSTCVASSGSVHFKGKPAHAIWALSSAISPRSRSRPCSTASRVNFPPLS